MNKNEYDMCILEGLNDKQINQIELLTRYYRISISMILKRINKDCSVDLLRKLNKVLQDPIYNKNNKIKEYMLNLTGQNIDFSPLLDKNLSEYKVECIYNILSIGCKTGIIDLIKYPNINDKMIKEIILDDFDRGINTKEYLLPEYSESQVYMAKEAYTKGYNNVLDVITKLNPKVKCVGLINLALNENIDIVNLSHTQNCDILDEIILAKIKGYNVDNFLNESSGLPELNFVKALLKHGYDGQDLINFMNKYRFNLYGINKNDLPGFIDLVENNIDPGNFIQNGWDYQRIENFIEVYNVLEDKQQQYFLNNFEYYRYWEIDFMKRCIKYDRKDVLNAAVYCTSPSMSSYDNILRIMEKDELRNERHDILNLFYDKGFDAFRECDETYEFTERQKEYLSEGMLLDKINDENINMIRDNSIDDDCMKILITMISKKYDITIPMRHIKEFNAEDLAAILTCMNIGLTVNDEKTKEILR